MNKQEKQTKTHRRTQKYGGYQRGGMWGALRINRVKYVMTEDLILGGGHTIQYTDHVS